MKATTVSLAAFLAVLASASPIDSVEKRDITCLSVGAPATATWTNAAGKTCRWIGVVGSNFGINSVNSGDYSCVGRCGGGCIGLPLGNAYTQDCFTHDVCSWFNNAVAGAIDANCGAAFTAAADDTLLGIVNGCGQDNPLISLPLRPLVFPICL